MSRTVIAVENLGKKYSIRHQQTRQPYLALRDVIADKTKSLVGARKGANSASSVEDFWALKDVSFQVKEGEVVGVIGRNGAGKSTLLKILSRITEPTMGRIGIRGRVASLLEVGTGFHAELTGRENIYLNGAILGMTREEIKRKFDEIVAFAEIEKFLDTPVKRYSSGMYMRLAFAVSAHLDPEILIVDEVLAVGDASFQKKCLGKMQSVAEAGRTVLFVSHNMTALQHLCSRALWLDKGHLMEDGAKNVVITKYLQTSAKAVAKRIWDDFESAPGNGNVKIHSARLISEGGVSTDVITVETPIRVEFEYWNLLSEADLNLSLHLYNLEGVCIFNSISSSARQRAGLVKGVCSIPGNLLNDGIYRVMIMVVKDGSVPQYVFEDILVFEVNDVEREWAWYGKWAGAVRPVLKWEVEQLTQSVLL
ncbi:MAG TPA: ABC transporter ATP-binding protein [Blastocatellia bacterium]